MLALEQASPEYKVAFDFLLDNFRVCFFLAQVVINVYLAVASLRIRDFCQSLDNLLLVGT